MQVAIVKFMAVILYCNRDAYAATWNTNYERVRNSTLTPAQWASSFQASFNVRTPIACNVACKKTGDLHALFLQRQCLPSRKQKCWWWEHCHAGLPGWLPGSQILGIWLLWKPIGSEQSKLAPSRKFGYFWLLLNIFGPTSIILVSA